jgi:hypothetical protein
MKRYELIGPDGPSMFQIIANSLENAEEIAATIIRQLNQQSERNATAPWRVEYLTEKQRINITA